MPEAGTPLRPALLLLGDSRLRWTLMELAKHVCEPSLVMTRDSGVPRLRDNNYYASSSRQNSLLRGCCDPLVAELEGETNWRGGGGFLCSMDARLSAAGFHLSFGVSPSAPYHGSGMTGRHRQQNFVRKGDFDNPSLDSVARSLAALERFVAARSPSPVIVVLASFLWDLGRLMLVDTRFNSSSSSLMMWRHHTGPWLAAYEANLTSFASAAQRTLLLSSSSGRQDGSSQRHAGHSLLLLADYGCGGSWAKLCSVMAPLVAERVRRVAHRLSLPFIDVHAMGTAAGTIQDLLKREYAYTLHPTLLGACVVWNAIAHAEPRVPNQTDPVRSVCAQRLRNVSALHGFVRARRESLASQMRVDISVYNR